MVACNRGKIMQKCKKRMALIMVFALCFGLSACGGGGSDNNDTVENEDDRCSDGSESDIYDSTDTVQYMASMESDNDNPAKQLGYSSIEEMRIQEHEIIASDDSDNTVAEGYWYPDGNRNSLTYIKIQIRFIGMNLIRNREMCRWGKQMVLYSNSAASVG